MSKNLLHSSETRNCPIANKTEAPQANKANHTEMTLPVCFGNCLELGVVVEGKHFEIKGGKRAAFKLIGDVVSLVTGKGELFECGKCEEAFIVSCCSGVGMCADETPSDASRPGRVS